MNSLHMPEVNTQTKPDQVVVSPSAHASHGGGPSMPGLGGSPARTAEGEASRHTKASVTKSFLTIDSPLGKRVDGDGRLSAVPVRFITDETRLLERYRAYVLGGDLISALEM